MLRGYWLLQVISASEASVSKLFPDVTNTSVTIITQWPGRSAEEVERFVTRPIEISMNTAQKKQRYALLLYSDCL